MLAEYLAIVRVLRRPMLRWWLRVGCWWLLAFLACHAYHVVYIWRIWQVVFNQQGSLSTALLICALFDHLSSILRQVIAWALFLSAAGYALRLLDRLVQDNALPSTASLPVQRFFLGLAQCGWILLISSIMNTLGGLAWNAAMQMQYPNQNILVPGILDYTAQLMHTAASVAQGYGWLAALLAAAFWRPLLAWVWAIVVSILPVVASETQSFLATASVQVPAAHGIGRPPGESVAVWAVTLLIMIFMLDGLRARRLALGYGLFITMAVASFIYNFWSYLPLQYLSTTGLVIARDISDWARYLWFMPAGFVPSWYPQTPSSLGTLVLALPPGHVSFSLPDIFQLASELLNMIWVALIWLLIVFLALRRWRGDPPGSIS